MRVPKRAWIWAAVAAVVAGGLIAGACYGQRATLQEQPFSEAPMERYLAEQLVLDPHISGAPLDAPAALSSASWSAVVEIVGTDPEAPDGCDVYVRYFAGHPGLGSAGDAPAAAQAGFAVAHVEDPDEPSGPVSFRFPRDGSLWEDDMRDLMPQRHWAGAKPGDFSDLESAWRARAAQ